MSLITASLAAEPAKKPEVVKPQWQRYLQGENAKTAAEQEKQRAALQQAGKFSEALQVAEALVKLRTQAQGADHWQTIDARWQVDAIGRALRQDDETRKQWANGFALLHQAAALHSKNRDKEAQPHFEKLVALHRKVLGEEHPHTATSYGWLAVSLNAQNKLAEAEAAYRKALTICRKVLGEEHPSTATSYWNLATNQYQQSAKLAMTPAGQGKYAEIRANMRRALDIRRKLLGEEHPDTIQCYNDLVFLLDTQSAYREAEEYVRKLLALKRRLRGEEHPETAARYGKLASNLNAQGKYAEAEASFRKALAIYRKLHGEEHVDTAASYNNLAINLHHQGKYAEAEEGYRMALSVLRKVLGENHPATATGYDNLAAVRNERGKRTEAEEGHRKALAICLKVQGEGHPKTGLAYNNLAYTLDDQRKYPEAEQCLRKALAIFRKALGEEHPRTALAYNNLGANLDAQSKPTEAEECFRTALAVYRKVSGEEHLDTSRGYANLARNLRLQGKYAEAEKLLRHAADSFAKVRLHMAATGLERATKTSQHSPLSALAAVLARNGKPADAWQRFEESLARGTWDDLTDRLRRSPAEREQQVQITARIDRLNQLIQRTIAAKPTAEQTKQRNELLSQLRLAYDELTAFTQQLEKKYGPAAGQVFSRDKIQAALPPDTALIGWLDQPGPAKVADPKGEHWAGLLRSTGDPVWVQLHGSGDKNAWTDADTRLPEDLRSALQKPRGDWQSLAARLRRQRLHPMAQHLQGVNHLIVLPSAALAGVPIEVIADTYTVSYAHSGTMYTHLRQQKPATGKGLFALADPVFDAAATQGKSLWPRLPGTRSEVATLQRLFGREYSQVLLDSDASEQRLNELAHRGELGKYRYLHLATHGEVNDVFPLRSAVILSGDHLPDEKQRTELLASGQPIPDGRLEAEEVLRRWNLHCDLVTLSACETALGKYERGEGFVGFAQAFVLCGARSVCLSLWRVDDTATALLMERFYQNVLGKREGLHQPMAKAAALAEAKTWLRNLSRQEAVKLAALVSKGVDRGKRPALPPLQVAPPVEVKSDHPFAHPYYWAAFVLVGHAD